MATQHSSPIVSVTRAALTAAVAFGLTGVFDGSGWLLAALVAAIAPHVIIGFAERRRISTPVTMAALLLGVVLFTAYVCVPHTMTAGLPSGDTFSTYSDYLSHASNTLRTATVPVEPTGPALLLALVSLWVAGAASEWSARRLDATLGAIGPSLVLFIAIAALGDEDRLIATVVYGLVGSAYLLALHQDEISERRSWFHGPRDRKSMVLPFGIICSLLVVATAAAAAPLLPGARSDAWFDYRSLGNGQGGTILKAPTPIVSIKAKLLSDPEHEVFTAKLDGDVKPYFRVIALDKYNGSLWTLEDDGRSAKTLSPATEPPLRRPLFQEYTILDADPFWLPAAYHPEEISLKDALVVPESSTLYLKTDKRLENLTYSVTSQVPDVSEAVGIAAPPVDPDKYERYLELPDEFPQSIRDLAAEVTADAATPYAQATALAVYLGQNDEFVYDQHVAQSESINTLEDFLFETKRGYCEQYAAAYAAMARSIGLPTRVAVGYRQGEVDSNGVYHVKNKNAHAWPEMYFDGLGWLSFEPTPTMGASTSGTPPTDAPNASTAPGSTANTTPTSVGTPTSAGPTATRPTQTPENPTVSVGSESGGDGAGPVGQAVRAVASLAALALLVVIGGIGVLAFLALRRTRHRRHAARSRDRVLGAWAEALDRLEDAGVEPRPAATSVEFALRHAPAHGAGDAGPPLMDLAQLQTAAMFSPDEPSEEDANKAWGYVDKIDHALAHAVPRLTRWRRRLDPRRVREPAEV